MQKREQTDQKGDGKYTPTKKNKMNKSKAIRHPPKRLFVFVMKMLPKGNKKIR